MRLPPSFASSLISLFAVAPTLAPADTRSCGQDAHPIAVIQGPGERSPFTGQTVTVEGILTYDRRGEAGLNGFYLQQADAEQDGDPATSEALFVYTDLSGGRVGQRLRITGQVREFHGLTELTRVQRLTECGQAPLPQPTKLKLPWSPDHQPEALEGMRVELATPLVVVDNFDLRRYGTLTLATALQPQPTQILPPGEAARALLQEQQAHRLLLDDGSNRRFPTPTPYPDDGLNLDQTLRAGTSISNLSGILDYRYHHWRLQPERPPRWRADNPRRDAPPRPPESTLRVMTLNLGNFFNGSGDGNRDFSGSRGADNRQQWQRQRRRLVAAVAAADPDVLAVTELENDGYGPASALVALAQGLGDDWQFIDRGEPEGPDAIRVGLLYRASRVTPVGPPRTPRAAPLRRHSRPPLAQDFQPITGTNTNTPPITIAVAHLKSKNCQRARGEDRDQHDGQGCYAARRTATAVALAHWLQETQATGTHAGTHAGTLLTGDLNSYARETPLQRLADAGFHNPATEQTDDAYSFRYRGRHGSLDYSLASTVLKPRVLQVHYWHINADEPRALDYAQAPPADDAVPWRSSDHDPVIVDLAL